MSPKIALLIDAENIPYKELPFILEEIPRHGQLVLRAIYGDWKKPALQKWYEVAQENDFHIRHQTSSARTKNSSDMKLIMDAMEVLFRTPVQVFCLVSNDGDYVALCDKIRDCRKSVIGIGYPHASEAFIRACDKFIFIRREVQPPAAPPPIKVGLRKLVVEAFARAPQDAEQWVSLPALGSALSQVQPDFKTKNYGHTNLTRLLQSMPDLVEIRGKNGEKAARLNNRNKLKKLLSDAFARTKPGVDGWVTIAMLDSALCLVQSSFKTAAYGYPNLAKLLESMPEFIELQTAEGIKSARLKA